MRARAGQILAGEGVWGARELGRRLEVARPNLPRAGPGVREKLWITLRIFILCARSGA